MKRNDLEMAEMVAEAGHDVTADLLSGDRSFVLCWSLGSFNAHTQGHSVGLNLYGNGVLKGRSGASLWFLDSPTEPMTFSSA